MWDALSNAKRIDRWSRVTASGHTVADCTAVPVSTSVDAQPAANTRRAALQGGAACPQVKGDRFAVMPGEWD